MKTLEICGIAMLLSVFGLLGCSDDDISDAATDSAADDAADTSVPIACGGTQCGPAAEACCVSLSGFGEYCPWETASGELVCEEGPFYDAGVDSGDDAGPEDAGDDAVASDAGDDSGLGECGAVLEVADAAAIVALAPNPYGSGTTAERASTGELLAGAEISLMANDFTRPSDCEAGCEVLLNVRGPVPGVSMAAEVLTIEAGAMFQVRFETRFLPPVGEFAMVSVERPCSQACEVEEQRCPEDLSCYRAGESYCRSCLGGTARMCACVDTEQMTLPDDTECSYIEGDIGRVGVCAGGDCTAGL